MCNQMGKWYKKKMKSYSNNSWVMIIIVHERTCDTYTRDEKKNLYFFFSHLLCILNESRKSCSHVNNTLGKSVKKQINTESVVFTKVWKIAQKISLERHITYIGIFFSCKVTSYNNNSWLQQIVKRKIKYFFYWFEKWEV